MVYHCCQWLLEKYKNTIILLLFLRKSKIYLRGGMELYILYNGISFSELIKIKSLTHLTKMKIIVVKCINVIDFLSHFPDQSWYSMLKCTIQFIFLHLHWNGNNVWRLSITDETVYLFPHCIVTIEFLGKWNECREFVYSCNKILSTLTFTEFFKYTFDHLAEH